MVRVSSSPVPTARSLAPVALALLVAGCKPPAPAPNASGPDAAAAAVPTGAVPPADPATKAAPPRPPEVRPETGWSEARVGDRVAYEFEYTTTNVGKMMELSARRGPGDPSARPQVNPALLSRVRKVAASVKLAALEGEIAWLEVRLRSLSTEVAERAFLLPVDLRAPAAAEPAGQDERPGETKTIKVGDRDLVCAEVVAERTRCLAPEPPLYLMSGLVTQTWRSPGPIASQESVRLIAMERGPASAAATAPLPSLPKLFEPDAWYRRAHDDGTVSLARIASRRGWYRVDGTRYRKAAPKEAGALSFEDQPYVEAGKAAELDVSPRPLSALVLEVVGRTFIHPQLDGPAQPVKLRSGEVQGVLTRLETGQGRIGPSGRERTTIERVEARDVWEAPLLEVPWPARRMPLSVKNEALKGKASTLEPSWRLADWGRGPLNLARP